MKHKKFKGNQGKSTMMLSNYQASIDSNWEITADTEMDTLTKRATGPTTDSLDKGSSSCPTNTLCYRKISKDKMIRARNRHSFHRQWLRSSTTFRSRNLTKPDLKHLSPNQSHSSSLFFS
jgi:hypothetical protein